MKIQNLPVVIQWNKFQPGTSFFIPCIDRKAMERAVLKEAKRLKISGVLCKQVVERGMYGLRVWRTNPTL